MQRTCAWAPCGQTFDAKRANAQYHATKCRVAAAKARNLGAAASAGAADGSNRSAVLAVLTSAGRQSTWRGVLAVTLAERVDATPGSGAATLAKQLEATLAEALKGVTGAQSLVDQLKERRDRKRLAS